MDAWGRNVVWSIGSKYKLFSKRFIDHHQFKYLVLTWSNDRDQNAMIESSSAAAIKTDGTLWLWGDSNDGSIRT